MTNCIFFLSFPPLISYVTYLNYFKFTSCLPSSCSSMTCMHLSKKCHSITPWACPIYARPLIKCATFCPSTQDAMDKLSRWCRWKCSWAFLHKSVMQNTQYMYICVIIISVLNVISTTCVTSCVYFNVPWFAFLEGSLAQVNFSVIP